MRFISPSVCVVHGLPQPAQQADWRAAAIGVTVAKQRSGGVQHMRAIIGLILMVVANPVVAADPPAPPPAVVKKLLDCRAITDAAQRLACLDAGTAALADAVEKRDVLVADRDQVKKARRSLFGITLPSFTLFGSGKEEGEETDEQGAITQIEANITSARAGAGNNWRFVLDDGSVWMQTDGRIFPRDPKPGMKIRIRRGAVGTFLANVDGQIAVRVRRITD
jgi:hypothetical protein